MIRVLFLGFGNLNFHLCKTLDEIEEVAIVQLFNRTDLILDEPLNQIPFTTNLSELKEADIYIIGIPDDAIQAFSEQLPFTDKLVVHTSGSVSMNSLSGKNRKGVFYPLQTFSKTRKIDFSEIPICVEAENEKDSFFLQKLAHSISKKVVEINSEERAKLHLAAVFVNNFVNYLYQIGSEILEENKLTFDLLKPLILETAQKIETLSPENAQTGLAKRHDLKTIRKQLLLLGDDSPHKKIYELFTSAIQEKYTPKNGKKL